jgi:hypothetical protein
MAQFRKDLYQYVMDNTSLFEIVMNVLKLVDRLNFSKANFSSDYIKGWQR